MIYLVRTQAGAYVLSGQTQHLIINTTVALDEPTALAHARALAPLLRAEGIEVRTSNLKPRDPVLRVLQG